MIHCLEGQLAGAKTHKRTHIFILRFLVIANLAIAVVNGNAIATSVAAATTTIAADIAVNIVVVESS